LISLVFQPEAKIFIKSAGEIDRYNDTQVFFNTERMNTLISTNGSIVIDNISKLYNLDTIEDQEVYLTSTVFNITPQAIVINTTISTLCNISEICLLINSSLKSDYLSGTYYPSNFYINTSLSDLIINNLTLYKNELRIYIEEARFVILGIIDINASDTELISFDTNVTSTSGDVFNI
jgi:hypothetical protein